MRKEYTKKRKNQHISLAERIKIEVGLATNQSIRSIAKQLKRSVSSISVEIKKGKYNGKYQALIADKRAIASALVILKLIRLYQHAAESLVWRCLLIEKLDIIGWLK